MMMARALINLRAAPTYTTRREDGASLLYVYFNISDKDAIITQYAIPLSLYLASRPTKAVPMKLMQHLQVWGRFWRPLLSSAIFVQDLDVSFDNVPHRHGRP